jgi:esterase/lipase superfamily enzyme
VRIFYATDRQPSPIRATYGTAYGADRSSDDPLSYGSALVSIPRDHKMGDLETSSFWSFTFFAGAEKFVTLRRVGRQDEASFFRDLLRRQSVRTIRSFFAREI